MTSNISYLINPGYLDEILGNFSMATGLHIEAVDKNGETFAIPGKRNRCDFCNMIRNNPQGKKKCIESYKRASLEASKWDEPYFFRCHAGLVIWAVPIVINSELLGSIICGQVLMWEPDNFFLQELKKNFDESLDFEKIKETVNSLEIISAKRSQAAAEMLYVVVNYLVKRNVILIEEEKASRLQSLEIRQSLENRKKEQQDINTDYENYLKKERRFLSFIRLGDKTRAMKNLNSLLTDLYTKSAGNKDTIKMRVRELASLTSRAAVEGGAEAEQVMEMLKEYDIMINEIDRIEQYFSKIHDIVEKFLEEIFALADKKHLSLVKNARNYIMENYHKPLTIKDTSDFLFISPSHLSRLFRQELGCTFNDYLTRVRVEKAVELMKKPELSVEQVSKAVGFQNQSYFAKIFRKFIGVTPLVYKNSLF